jgi:hypothetical protein
VDDFVFIERLVWPLLRLSLFISLGLFIGTLIEALHWTKAIAKLATPLVRIANLRDVSGASFSMAFFSGVTANTMLAEAYDQGRLSKRELVLSNLFNSLPTFFLHMPTTFLIIAPLIREAAVPYLGLTLLSAFLRLGFVILLSRTLLPKLEEQCVVCVLPEEGRREFRHVLRRAWERFRKRIPKILMITVPIYTAFFFLNRAGIFRQLEAWMSENVTLLSWLPPEAMGIVALQIASELSGGMAAAGALLEEGALTVRQTVLALLMGNILSSPMRMLRHQFPYYAGIFKPRLGMNLILYNQALRAGSIVAVMVIYLLLG